MREVHGLEVTCNKSYMCTDTEDTLNKAANLLEMGFSWTAL